MALRFLRLFNHWFALVAFWAYLVAFGLAFAMVIVFFPVGALAILFAAILALPVVVILSTTLGACERAWTRRWLRRRRCPSCLDRDCVDAASAPVAYECGRCGARFDATGETASTE